MNNWNEERKEHQQYLVLLENLKSNAETNRVRLSEEVDQAVYVRDRIEQFLEIVSADDNDVPVDTLAEYSVSLFQITSFSNSATSAYETAKSMNTAPAPTASSNPCSNTAVAARANWNQPT